MNIVTQNDQPTVATIGFFDGAHRGHRFLIEQVKEVAKGCGMKSMIVTFPIHPRKVLCQSYQPELLTVCDEKLEILEKTGIDLIALLSFTLDVSRMSAAEFMEMLHRDFCVKVLVIGYDHRFGHDRKESFADYVKYGKEIGIDVVQAEEAGKEQYSSTRVRKALENGEVEKAAEILGYNYFLKGNIVRGFHNGTELGFPTANIQVPENKLIPKRGVYLVKATLSDKTYYGMLNIGSRPTLNNGKNVSIEVHLFDEFGDLYGQELTVEILKFIREEQKFDSLELLKEQLTKDKTICLTLIEN